MRATILAAPMLELRVITPVTLSTPLLRGTSRMV
jgi:hypothetical protein